MIPIVIALLFNLFQNGEGFARDDPVVVTDVGTIRGLRGDFYSMYLGIPYAIVNESNYFGDSLPHPPFEGIFEANDDTQLCPQREDFNNTLAGLLDCMRVSVYVPDSASPTNLLPVMIWMFGGRFEIGFYGSFNFGPQYLIRHDVIFVSVNYRLGAYGFMCLDIPEVPGNQGLKDQARAIKWVKDNIAAFGGDPDKISLAGNSAGGMSVGLHVVSDDEKNFNSVMMHSGSSIFPYLLTDSDPSVPVTVANRLGFPTNNTYEALSFLQTANVLSVTEASEDFYYRPCVEKKFDGVPSFLTDYPINLKQTKSEGMTILQGYTNWEGLIDYGPSTYDPLLFYHQLNDTFIFDEDTLSELESIVRRFYIGDEEINESQKWKLLEFTSDFSFISPPMRSLKKFFESGAEKVYQYVFSYDGPRNYVKIRRNIDEPGAAHGDDLGYLFNMTWDQMPAPTPEDQLIIDRMTMMWTNFMKYGDPTPEINELLPVKWLPITKDSPYNYLEINTKLVAGKAHYHSRMAFWDLFFDAFEKNQKGYRDVEEDDDATTDNASTIYLNPILTLAIIVYIRVLVL